MEAEQAVIMMLPFTEYYYTELKKNHDFLEYLSVNGFMVYGV